MEEWEDDRRSIRQWALRANIPYRTLLEAAKSGDLPAIQFTRKGQIYVYQSDFQQWIEESKRRPIRDVVEEKDVPPPDETTDT